MVLISKFKNISNRVSVFEKKNSSFNMTVNQKWSARSFFKNYKFVFLTAAHHDPHIPEVDRDFLQ